MTNEQIQKYIEENMYHEDGTPMIDVQVFYEGAKWMRDQALSLHNVVKSLPNDEEVKAYIDTLPYYGTCTTEYNEGFEYGVKWLKEQLAK